MSHRTRSGRASDPAAGTAGRYPGTFHHVDIRPATPDDEAAILGLLARSLGRPDDPRFTELFRWKHDRNHFGPSYRWVMVDGDDVIGVRLFMRWRFVGLGRTWEAVRAVDTATAPEHQGRGIFKALTLHALAAAEEDGVDFVFNTPNGQSRPGYLKMGWRPVGNLRPMIRPRLRSLPRLVSSRVPASHWGEPLAGGVAVDAIADEVSVPALTGSGLTTMRSPGFLRWRYPEALFGYRAFPTRGGVAIVRCRRRGSIVEATLADLCQGPSGPTERRAQGPSGPPERRAQGPSGPPERRAQGPSGPTERGAQVQGHSGEPEDPGGTLLRRTGADAVVALGLGPRAGFVPMPGTGPALVQRPLGPDAPPATTAGWQLTLGDVELF